MGPRVVGVNIVEGLENRFTEINLRRMVLISRDLWVGLV